MRLIPVAVTLALLTASAALAHPEPDGFHITAQDTYKQSNGGAETHTYAITVHTPDAGAVELVAADVPQGWSVSFSPSTFTATAGGEQEATVTLTTGFAHEHGASPTFTVIAVQGDAGATKALGVHYYHTPQPAGHHNTLFLHGVYEDEPLVQSLGGPGFAYASTRDVDFDANLWGDSDGQQTTWDVAVGYLHIGIDVDLDRNGQIVVPLRNVPAGGTLEGRVIHTSHDGDKTTIATISPASVPAAPYGTATVASEVVGTPDGDYIPAESGARLDIELVFTGAGFPALQTDGGSMQLPLDEFQ